MQKNLNPIIAGGGVIIAYGLYMHINIVSYKKVHTENKLLQYYIEHCVIYRPELKEISDFMYFTDLFSLLLLIFIFFCCVQTTFYLNR